MRLGTQINGLNPRTFHPNRLLSIVILLLICNFFHPVLLILLFHIIFRVLLSARTLIARIYPPLYLILLFLLPMIRLPRLLLLRMSLHLILYMFLHQFDLSNLSFFLHPLPIPHFLVPCLLRPLMLIRRLPIPFTHPRPGVPFSLPHLQ